MSARQAGTLDQVPGVARRPDPQQYRHLDHKVVCTLTVTAGTAVGGWRIIKTLGDKPVHLRPIRGFVAETSGGIAYWLLRLLQVLGWD